MIYKGFQITAHINGLIQCALNDDGSIAEELATTHCGEIECFSASNADGLTLTTKTLADLRVDIERTIIPPTPVGQGNTYYRSLYLREADKVATLQNAVDQFANRVIIAETELAIVRDQLAQLRTGRDL